MSESFRRQHEFGPFLLDVAEQILLRDGRPVSLKPKLFDLLLVLVENNGHVLDKNELMNEVWPDTFVEENNLTVSIFALRKVLGDHHNNHSYIETVPRRGYRFVAQVRTDNVAAGSRTNGALRDARPYVRSIAVLPFKTLGLESSEEYLGLGLADALITRLSNVKQVIVRPTSAVRDLAGEDPLAAGRKLRVTAVLDGTIQRRDESVRVTVQLVSIRDRAALWAAKFDEKFTNIFAIEDSISEQVARALAVKLTAEEQAELAKRYTEKTLAYQAYLKGRYFIQKRTPEGFKKGIKYFERAIKADAGYALAYAGLAELYNLLANLELLPPREAAQKAKEAALKALEIDNELAEAHAALGYNRMIDWDWSSAEREFKLAIELNQNSAIGHRLYSVFLRGTGRFSEALAESKKAEEIDPTSTSCNGSVGASLYCARRYDQAIEQLGKALELDSNNAFAHHSLGRSYLQQSRYSEAIAEHQQVINLIGTHPESLAHLGYIYGVIGEKAAAYKILTELQELSKTDYVYAYYKALVYAGLEEKVLAFEWLERAYQEHDQNLVLLGIDPLLDSLRADPKFVRLLDLVGLPPGVGRDAAH